MQPIIQELKLSEQSATNEPKRVQQSVVYHLLEESQINMTKTFELLAPEEQPLFIHIVLQKAQESLFLAGNITDSDWGQRFWKRYGDLLGHLFHWHEQWSEYHNELLAMLRMVVRRYSPEQLTAMQMEIIQRLTQRLHEQKLYKEDIFSATHALNDANLDIHLDFSPIANQLFDSYLNELGRSS